MSSKSSSQQQCHPTFPDYPWWVITKLLGIYANDPNNVVVAIVGRWLEENEEKLEKKGISVAEWRKTTGPQAVVKPIKEGTPNGKKENGGSGERSNGG